MSLWLSNSILIQPSIPLWLEELCQKVSDNDESLKTIELTHPRIDDIHAKVFSKALSENVIVQTLILSCFSIVDDGAFEIGSVIAKSKTIRKLQFRELRNAREVITIFRLLRQNTSIEELSLRHCQICPLGAEPMHDYLMSRECLQEVRFVDCQFHGGETLAQVCRGLAPLRSGLQRLYLVNTDIGSEGASHVASIIMELSSLRELYLGENSLGDNGTTVVASAVLLTSLRILDLRANSISSTGALALQGMLARSQHLVSLLLSNNELGNLGAAALARGLKSRSVVLEKLDLSENGIDHAGAKAIASSLRVNMSLEELDLSFNSLGDVGVTFIARSLTRNQKLKRLSLLRNGISNEGARVLSCFLPMMLGLKELRLSKNNIEKEGYSALLNALRCNVELEYLQIENSCEIVSREIGHWIQLNKAGRRIFRSANVPCGLWPQVFSRSSSDSGILFHFVRERPEVVAAYKTYESKFQQDTMC